MVCSACHAPAVIHNAITLDALRIVRAAGLTAGVLCALAEDADISIGAFDAPAWVIALAGVGLARRAWGARDDIARSRMAKCVLIIDGQAGLTWWALTGPTGKDALRRHTKVPRWALGIFIGAAIAVIITPITSLRRQWTAAATGVEEALIGFSIAVVVAAVTKVFARTNPTNAVKQETIIIAQGGIIHARIAATGCPSHTAFADITNIDSWPTLAKGLVNDAITVIIEVIADLCCRGNPRTVAKGAVDTELKSACATPNVSAAWPFERIWRACRIIDPAIAVIVDPIADLFTHASAAATSVDDGFVY